MYSVDIVKLTEEWNRIQDQLSVADVGSERWFVLQEASDKLQRQIEAAKESHRKDEAQANEEVKTDLEHRDRVYKAKQDRNGKVLEVLGRIAAAGVTSYVAIKGVLLKWKLENDDTNPGIVRIDEVLKWLLPRA